MPKLDGVSATSLIRQFDHMTPIISMTSNSKPNEIMTYYSSGMSKKCIWLVQALICVAGMNDILPKPFTKDGLFDMLEVSPRHPSRIVLSQHQLETPHAPQSNPTHEPIHAVNWYPASFRPTLRAGAHRRRSLPHLITIPTVSE